MSVAWGVERCKIDMLLYLLYDDRYVPGSVTPVFPLSYFNVYRACLQLT